MSPATRLTPQTPATTCSPLLHSSPIPTHPSPHLTPPQPSQYPLQPYPTPPHPTPRHTQPHLAAPPRPTPQSDLVSPHFASPRSATPQLTAPHPTPRYPHPHSFATHPVPFNLPQFHSPIHCTPALPALVLGILPPAPAPLSRAKPAPPRPIQSRANHPSLTNIFPPHFTAALLLPAPQHSTPPRHAHTPPHPPRPRPTPPSSDHEHACHLLFILARGCAMARSKPTLRDAAPMIHRLKHIRFRQIAQRARSTIYATC